MPRAGGEEGALVWEVAVDGGPLHARSLGNGADARPRGSHGPVQLDGGFGDPPSRFLLVQRTLLEFVPSAFHRTTSAKMKTPVWY
jgi:hypothetical protein